MTKFYISANKGKGSSLKNKLKRTGYAALSATTISNKILIVKPKKY